VTAAIHTDEETQSLIGELATFLVATATVLRETITHFEKTTARITESVMRPGQVNTDLIVTLQDFDRLHQEFTALAEVLARVATKTGESWLRAKGGGHPVEDVIATISIGDLKERLMRCLGPSMMNLSSAPEFEEVVF
jgi:hypothetical protein